MTLVKQFINRNPGIYRFLASYIPLMVCGPIMAAAGVHSENLYMNQFNDVWMNRTANDDAVAFAIIWVPCSFFINAGLLYAGEKCGRAFASKVPLFGAIFVHALCFNFLNNPIEVLTPYWSIEFTGPKFRDQLNQLQLRTIISVIALHLVSAILIATGPKLTALHDETSDGKRDPISINPFEVKP